MTLVGCLAAAGCRADAGPPHTVIVELTPAVAGDVLDAEEVVVRLQPGDHTAIWTLEHPAQFKGMAAGRTYAVQLPGRFLYSAAPVLTDRSGFATIAIPVLEIIDPTRHLDPCRGVGDECPRPDRVLYVETPGPASRRFTWREGSIVVVQSTVQESALTLSQFVQNEWKMNGQHRARFDPRRDQAVVLLREGMQLVDVQPLLRAFGEVRREMEERYPGGRYRSPSVTRDRPAFAVRAVQAADLAPPPPPPPISPVPEFVNKPLQVRVGAISAHGRIDPAVVQRAVEGRVNDIRRCYARALVRNPRVRGRIAVRFVAGADGRVGRVSRFGSELQDPDLEDCVQERFEGLVLPPPERGIVTVTAPFMLIPAQETP